MYNVKKHVDTYLIFDILYIKIEFTTFTINAFLYGILVRNKALWNLNLLALKKWVTKNDVNYGHMEIFNWSLLEQQMLVPIAQWLNEINKNMLGAAGAAPPTSTTTKTSLSLFCNTFLLSVASRKSGFYLSR